MAEKVYKVWNTLFYNDFKWLYREGLTNKFNLEVALKYITNVFTLRLSIQQPDLTWLGRQEISSALESVLQTLEEESLVVHMRMVAECVLDSLIPIHWRTFACCWGGRVRGIVWISRKEAATARKYVSSLIRNQVIRGKNTSENSQHKLSSFSWGLQGDSNSISSLGPCPNQCFILPQYDSHSVKAPLCGWFGTRVVGFLSKGRANPA